MSDPTNQPTTTTTPSQDTVSQSTPPSPTPAQPSNVTPPSVPAATPANTDVVAPPADQVSAPEAEEYELEIDDSSPLSEADLNEIAEEASRLRLSKDDATKLIQHRETAYKAGMTKAQAEYQARIDSARKEIMADPMFSPENAPKTFESMKMAVETFGDEDMVKLVQSAEFGNNVVLARFLKKLGDALRPDESSVTGGKGSAGAGHEDGASPLKSLYPDFFK